MFSVVCYTQRFPFIVNQILLLLQLIDQKVIKILPLKMSVDTEHQLKCHKYETYFSVILINK